MNSVWQNWQEVAPLIGGALLSWSLQAELLLAAMWIGARLLRRKGASLRASLWLTAFLLLPLLPVVTQIIPLPAASLEGLRSRLQAETAGQGELAPPAESRESGPTVASGGVDDDVAEDLFVGRMLSDLI